MSTFWSFINKHPFISFLMVDTVVSGLVRIIRPQKATEVHITETVKRPATTDIVKEADGNVG